MWRYQLCHIRKEGDMHDKYPNIDSILRRLELPSLLVKLMKANVWSRLDPDRLTAFAPFIQDRLVVLPTFDSMLFNSGPLMGDDEEENEQFHEYRGSCLPERPLPWIDVEKTMFILCNEALGYDCGIALDYRTGFDRPRVIGADWHSGFHGVKYRLIADSFDEFSSILGLPGTADSHPG